jgi:hypothetical protein
VVAGGQEVNLTPFKPNLTPFKPADPRGNPAGHRSGYSIRWRVGLPRFGGDTWLCGEGAGLVVAGEQEVNLTPFKPRPRSSLGHRSHQSNVESVAPLQRDRWLCGEGA